MEREPTSFTYQGQTVIIYPGSHFIKKEIVSRLKEMNFNLANLSYSKNDLAKIYDITISYDNNKLLIFNKLIKDTQNFKSIHNSHRRQMINDDNMEYPDKFNDIKKYTFDGTLNNEKEYNIPNDESFTSSPSLFMKFLTFLNNHKMDILEKAFYLFLIFSYDSFMKNYAKKHFILGKLAKYIRRIISKKRLMIFFLVFYIVKYLLNVFFYYLFGFGVFAIMAFAFQNKIKDFIISALSLV
jgi:hypothetical protein